MEQYSLQISLLVLFDSDRSQKTSEWVAAFLVNLWFLLQCVHRAETIPLRAGEPVEIWFLFKRMQTQLLLTMQKVCASDPHLKAEWESGRTRNSYVCKAREKINLFDLDKNRLWGLAREPR